MRKAIDRQVGHDDEASAGLVGVPGLDPDHAALTEECVEVANDARHREGGLRLANDLGQHWQPHRGLAELDEVGRDAHTLGGEAADIGVMRRTHAQRRRPRIHAADEGRRAAHVPGGQHFGEVAGRWQQQSLQQLVLAELLAGHHGNDRLVLVSLGEKGVDIGSGDGEGRTGFIQRQGMVLEHE